VTLRLELTASGCAWTALDRKSRSARLVVERKLEAVAAAVAMERAEAAAPLASRWIRTTVLVVV
jgi:hypothetical protein